MKIIAINGSPRKYWNTYTLLNEALKGAESRGAEIELINLYNLNYKGCISCFECKRKGVTVEQCVVKDGLFPVLEKIRQSDGVVLGSPIYFGNVTGEMRSLMERLFFPYISYDKKPTSFGKKIKTAFIYTMNVPESFVDEIGYSKMFTDNARVMERPDFPIIMRMNGDDFLEGGITIDQAIEHARIFEDAGINALDISSGPFETHQWQFPTLYQPFGTLVSKAAAIKKAVKVPIIVVAKLDAAYGEQVLKEGAADFIEMGRALMADPELPNKAKAGKLDEITPCIYCGHCQERGTEGSFSTCTVNPAMGRELEVKIEPAARKKKVVVIGGGPAGMQAAWTAAERGHETYLYEKSDNLGGQWSVLANYRAEADRLINYLSKGMERAGVKVSLKQSLTPQKVREMKPDAVIVATGSAPITLDVPGIDGKNVVQAIDVLTGKAEVGQDVVVIGGRVVGINTALFLAEKGKSVSIVTRSKIARELSHNTKLILYEYLIKKGVRLFPNTIPDSITEKGVNLQIDSGEAPEKDYIFSFLKADTVVLAVGSVNDSRLGEELSGLMAEVYPIGDCASKRSIFAAMREGWETGRKL